MALTNSSIIDRRENLAGFLKPFLSEKCINDPKPNGASMRVLLHLFALVTLLLPLTAYASGDDDWHVAKASSQVRYTTDQSMWKDLQTGDVVPNSAWISTGPRGRVQLVRGVESIGFQPSTLAAITTKSGGLFSARKTNILQQIGELDLEIEKRSQPHTTVQTPYLAAVVKGTIFHVSVGKTNASVSVDRGLVQVTSFASGQLANVGPRQRATVDRKSGMKVSGANSRPTISPVAPSVAVVPAVGTTALAGQAEVTTDDKGKSSKASNDASAKDAAQSNGKSGKGSSGSNDSGKSGNGNNGNGGGNGSSNGNSGSNGNGGSSGAGSSGNNGNGNSGNGGGNSGNAGGNGKGNNGNGGGNGGGKGNSGKGNNK
ncbi:hypothetical protein [Rhizobium sp. BE258]|uniref:hypothetical protein n=1 Tax=Rhizobium sp. BE258 TaxID=2817722 RepID=UPI002855F557|nr:hypothetical protein [Rhizobium sp. BE258]MDR7147637.1 hypothetical protein [Rhizobium sp. BE258]